jgi:cysteine desulfurase
MSREDHYLDHAATTPLRPEAKLAWAEVADVLGNASSLHGAGRRVRRIVEESRERIGAALSVRPSEVIFTSGGTEADNLAVKGFAWAQPERRTIITSPVEHHAVLDPVEWLVQHEDRSVHWLPVDGVGRVDAAALTHYLESAPADEVALCTVMWANNEIGTVQPISELAAVCAERGVAFHTDAVQAIGALPLPSEVPGLTAMTISGHKLGAPVGVGALVLDRDAQITPVLHGGGQERDIRSGTVDAAGISAFAVAVECAVAEQAVLSRRLTVLRDDLIAGILAAIPGTALQGDPGQEPGSRLPGNIAITFDGCEADALLMLLDAAGIACSTGSACTSGVPEPSHVLLAVGCDPTAAQGTLRFSLGRTSTTADADALMTALPGAVERARRAGRPRLAPWS